LTLCIALWDLGPVVFHKKICLNKNKNKIYIHIYIYTMSTQCTFSIVICHMFTCYIWIHMGWGGWLRNWLTTQRGNYICHQIKQEWSLSDQCIFYFMIYLSPDAYMACQCSHVTFTSISKVTQTHTVSHTRTHTQTQTHTATPIWIYAHTCICTYTHIHTNTQARTNTTNHTHKYMYATLKTIHTYIIYWLSHSRPTVNQVLPKYLHSAAY